jgi:hypothetical protein
MGLYGGPGRMHPKHGPGGGQQDDDPDLNFGGVSNPDMLAPPDTDYDPPDRYDDDATPVQSGVLGGFVGETVVVNKAAFDAFVTALGALPAMLTADAGLAGVDIQPGTLPNGEVLKSKMNGPSGEFTRSCIHSFDGFRDRLTELHEDLSQASAAYTAGQENIEINAQELTKMFQEALGQPTSAGTQTPPPTTV